MPSLRIRVAVTLLACVAIPSGARSADGPPDAGAGAVPTGPAAPPARRDYTLQSYVDLKLRLRRGDLTIEGARPGRLAQPVEQKLYRGRYLACLLPRSLVGARALAVAIRERAADPRVEDPPVPFDFPLLAEADAGEAQDLDRLVRTNASATTTVRVPAPDDEAEARERVIAVLDTQTGRVVTRALSPPARPPR